MAAKRPLGRIPGRPGLIWRTVIFLLALGVLLLITTRWRVWETNASRQSTDDAYLQSDLTPISARVSGYIREMPVQDFERVRKGQLLAQLVDDDYRATVAQLTASVAAAAAQIGTIGAQRGPAGFHHPGRPGRGGRGPGQRRSECPRSHPAAEAAEHRLLLDGGGRETQDHRRAARRPAAAGAGAGERGGNTRWWCSTPRRVQAAATLGAQQAALNLAQINLGYTRITAPEDGVIGQRQLKPGQLVGIGGQLTTLTPLPRIWVIANFKETQLTHMRVGAPARIAVDTFPGHTLRGHVLAFAPGSGSQFACCCHRTMHGQLHQGRTAVAVKLAIDDADGLLDQLRPGLSVVATVDTDGSAR